MRDDGFFKTGDLGYRLADGALIFTARANDALRIGGYLVSPLEIEEVVAALPGVTACQVVAVRGPSGSPRPVAFITGHGPPIGEDAIIAHCASHLAKYKVPIRVIALDSFPQTDGPNGAKVKKAALRKLAEDVLHAPA